MITNVSVTGRPSPIRGFLPLFPAIKRPLPISLDRGLFLMPNALVLHHAHDHAAEPLRPVAGVHVRHGYTR